MKKGELDPAVALQLLGTGAVKADGTAEAAGQKRPRDEEQLENGAEASGDLDDLLNQAKKSPTGSPTKIQDVFYFCFVVGYTLAGNSFF